MTVYLIADVKVTDDGWVPACAASVHDVVHKHGGKYLSRSGNVKTLEGKPLDTTLIALLQFPSAEAAEAFVTDPEYAPYARSPQGRQRKPFPANRRHRSSGNNSLSAEGMINRKRLVRLETSRLTGSRKTARRRTNACEAAMAAICQVLAAGRA